MSIQFSLAHLTLLACSPIELIEIAGNTGFDHVGLRLTPVCKNERVHPIISSKQYRNEVKQALLHHNVSVLDIELALLRPNIQPEHYLFALEAGAELGARHCICQVPDPDQHRAADKFATMCELAKPFNISIDLEFIPWSDTPDLNTAVNILRHANQHNAGLLIDVLHFARSRSSLEQLSSLPAKWFNFMHLCDAEKKVPKTTEGLIHTARYDRAFPGQGEINLHDIIQAMPAVVYALEIPNTKLKNQLGQEEYARQALHHAKRVVSAQQQRLSNHSF